MENLKLMMAADVRAFMRESINPEPGQTFEDGKSYPNMKITPDDAENRVAQENCHLMGLANDNIYSAWDTGLAVPDDKEIGKWAATSNGDMTIYNVRDDSYLGN